MRLIDKDEILNLIGAIVSKFPEEYDEKTYKMIRREIRNKNREVEAIPIEWIKEWYKKALSKSGFMGDEMVSVEDLLEDWEKENE